MTQPELFQFGGLSIEIKIALLVALVAVAAGFDLKSRRIPNWLVLVGLVSSFIVQILFNSSGSFSGFKAWGLGLLVGFGLFLPLYLLRAMGAGDVKLMAMVGAFLGPVSALGAVLTALVVGGVQRRTTGASPGRRRSAGRCRPPACRGLPPQRWTHRREWSPAGSRVRPRAPSS